MSFSDNELIDLRDNFYAPLASNDGSKKRLNSTDDSSRKRNDYQRDYTRIIYSSSFRRLQGKMQLLGVEYDKFFRNRLTHSIEVAQIARSIAEDIGHDIKMLDPDDPQNNNIYVEDLYVVESCALAHDIGNPPFGHQGESVLHSLCSDTYGFEGNAQALRILMELEKKYPNFGGLNLTLRTLLGITKYFKKYKVYSDDGEEKRNKKFIYDNAYEILKEKTDEFGIKQRTIDVQIVDISDEVAYAAHDLEDTLSMNLFTIDDILYEFQLLDGTRYKGAFAQLESIVNSTRNYAKQAHRYKSSEEYSFLFRKELTAKIVNTLIHDIHLIEVNDEKKDKTGTSHSEELGFKECGGLAKALKDVVFNCVNRRDSVQLYEMQGERIIKGLYDVFINHEKYLPVEFRFSGCVETERTKRVLDYISGMMDSFAISSYLKFYGPNSLDRIFVESL